jgi:hypothetical protein
LRQEVCCLNGHVSRGHVNLREECIMNALS